MWDDAYVSGYATTHPCEDRAETLAHYLHIRDTLQTANPFGIRVTGTSPPTPTVPTPGADVAAFETILDQWLSLSYALNGVNRSMGKADLYPFVLSPKVVEKLGFVPEVVRQLAALTSPPRQ